MTIWYRLGLMAQWWGRQWQIPLSSVPYSFHGSRPTRRVVVRPDDDGVEFKALDGRGNTLAIETIAWSGYSRDLFERWLKKVPAGPPVNLSLSTRQAIADTLMIPKKAAQRAHDIVREHIDRRTPLGSEEIVIGHALKPAGHGKFELNYVLVPRTMLNRLLTQLGLKAEEVAALEARSPIGPSVIAVPFNHPEHRRSWLAGTLIAVLGLATVLGLFTGYAALYWRQSRLLATMEARIDEKAAAIRQALPRADPDPAGEVSRFTAARSSSGIVQIWDELARLLPDSAFLTELEISGDRLLASGYASSPPELIPLLEGSSLLQGAAFSGPLIFDRVKGKDRFSVRAMLRQSRVPATERP